jgi:hypothetical protein
MCRQRSLARMKLNTKVSCPELLKSPDQKGASPSGLLTNVAKRVILFE